MSGLKGRSLAIHLTTPTQTYKHKECNVKQSFLNCSAIFFTAERQTLGSYMSTTSG